VSSNNGGISGLAYIPKNTYGVDYQGADNADYTAARGIGYGMNGNTYVPPTYVSSSTFTKTVTHPIQSLSGRKNMEDQINKSLYGMN